MHRLPACLLVLALGLCPLAFAAADDAAEDAADLRQNQDSPGDQAIQLFLIHKYEEALVLFRERAAKDPTDILSRRYLGACLSALRRDEEAFIELNEILLSSPQDLPTLKQLAKMHLRRGEPAQAKGFLEKLVRYDVLEGRFAPYAKTQLEKLQTIESSSAAVSGGQMGAEEFMKTKAVIHFMDAEFEKSIAEFDLLEALYPKDVMVKRYKGIALDKLKRYDEAVRAFKQGLEVAPENAALRYGLAQTLFHRKDMDASRAELKLLSQSSITSDYKVRADRDLEAIERIETLREQVEGKKWTLMLEQGIEFNSNAASEPKKRQVIAEEHAIRWPGTVYGSYQLKKEDPWTLSASYAYAQAFYSDTLDYLNTRVHVPTLTVTHMGKLWDRPLLTMFSTGYVHVSVENEFYNQSYPQTLRWVYSFWDRHRLIVSERVAWTDFKDQGNPPSEVSREGIGNSINVTNNFYFNDKRDLYLGVGYEYRVDDTEGSIYVRNVHQVNTDFNFPVWRDWTGLVGFRFKNSDYPETVLDIQRNDDEYLVNTRLTIPMNKTTSMRLFYDYLNNDSNDPIYNYINHSGGVSLVANF